MKKEPYLLILIFAISTAATVHAEMLKEGSGKYLGGKTGTYTIIRMGDGRQQINWDEYGVITSAPKDSPFYNVSYHMIGTKQVENGNYKSSGGGIFTRPNGDTFYGVSWSKGSLAGGTVDGGVEINNGTGECSFMTGQMKAMPGSAPVVYADEGVYSGVITGTLQWIMP